MKRTNKDASPPLLPGEEGKNRRRQRRRRKKKRRKPDPFEGAPYPPLPSPGAKLWCAIRVRDPRKIDRADRPGDCRAVGYLSEGAAQASAFGECDAVVPFYGKYLAVRARARGRNRGWSIRTLSFSNCDELAAALGRPADRCRSDADLMPRAIAGRPWWLFARRQHPVRLFDPPELRDPYVVPVDRGVPLRDDPPRKWFPTAGNRRIGEFAVPRVAFDANDAFDAPRVPKRGRGKEAKPERKRKRQRKKPKGKPKGNRSLDEFFGAVTVPPKREEDKGQHPCFSDLPADVVRLVCDRLTPWDAEELAGVNWACRNAVANHSIYWRRQVDRPNLIRAVGYVPVCFRWKQLSDRALWRFTRLWGATHAQCPRDLDLVCQHPVHGSDAEASLFRCLLRGDMKDRRYAYVRHAFGAAVGQLHRYRVSMVAYAGYHVVWHYRGLGMPSSACNKAVIVNRRLDVTVLVGSRTPGDMVRQYDKLLVTQAIRNHRRAHAGRNVAPRYLGNLIAALASCSQWGNDPRPDGIYTSPEHHS